MKSKILFTGVLSLFFAGAMTTIQAQKVGTTSFQFLKVMPTARATAMGDAYGTLAEGADAMFWNPAGIVTESKFEMSSTLTSWLFDSKQEAIALAMSLGSWGTAGLQFQYVDYGEIEETRVDQLGFVGTGADYHYNPGLTGRTFSPKAYVFGMSYAKKLTDKFAAGLTAKYAYESLFDQATVSLVDALGETKEYKTYASAVLFDFGLQYNTGFRSIQLGISVQNLGQQVQYGTEAYSAPLTFRLGAAANLVGPSALIFPMEDQRLTFAYDLHQPNDYAQQMHFGLEYSFENLVNLRTGYKWNYDTDGMTYGAGLNVGVQGYKLFFDYSYGAMGEFLGQVHRITLGVKAI